MSSTLVRDSKVVEIVGDLLKVVVPTAMPGGARHIAFGDLGLVEDPSGFKSLARIIKIEGERVSLQVFSGTKGLTTKASVRFLGHPMRAAYSSNILGRVFRGDGTPLDTGPDLSADPTIKIDGPSANPARRLLASKMVRTDVPMIDIFNSLVESQKIPIFSVAGEPYNDGGRPWHEHPNPESSHHRGSRERQGGRARGPAGARLSPSHPLATGPRRGPDHVFGRDRIGHDTPLARI